MRQKVWYVFGLPEFESDLRVCQHWWVIVVRDFEFQPTTFGKHMHNFDGIGTKVLVYEFRVVRLWFARDFNGKDLVGWTVRLKAWFLSTKWLL